MRNVLSKEEEYQLPIEKQLSRCCLKHKYDQMLLLFAIQLCGIALLSPQARHDATHRQRHIFSCANGTLSPGDVASHLTDKTEAWHTT